MCGLRISEQNSSLKIVEDRFANVRKDFEIPWINQATHRNRRDNFFKKLKLTFQHFRISNVESEDSFHQAHKPFPGRKRFYFDSGPAVHDNIIDPDQRFW